MNAHTSNDQSLDREIRAKLDSGDLEGAYAHLESLPVDEQDSLPSARLRIKILRGLGQRREALAECERLLARYPDDPSLLSHAIRLLLAEDRVTDAAALLEERLWPSRATPELKLRTIPQLLSKMAPRAATALLERLRARDEGQAGSQLQSDPNILYRTAVAEYRCGLLGQALARLARGAADGTLSSAAQVLRSELLGRTGRVEEALTVASAALGRGLDRPEHAARVIRLLVGTERWTEAMELIEESLGRWPVDAMLLVRFNTLPLPPEMVQRIYRRVRVNRANHEFCERALLQFALMSLDAGEPEVGHRIFEELGLFGGAFSRFPVERLLRSDRLVDDRTKSVQVVRRPGAVATLAVFMGVRHRFDGLSAQYLDSCLAELPVHVVYLRDHKYRCFLGGIPEFGSTAEAAAAGLARCAAELGAPRIITLGASLGGFAALRYGALAGAVGSISFSGPTKLYTPPDRPHHVLPTFCRWEFAEFSPRERDAFPDVAGADRMRTHVVVGGSNVEDLRQAERLARLRHVQLHVEPGVTAHAGLATDAIASGRLRALVEEGLAA